MKNPRNTWTENLGEVIEEAKESKEFKSLAKRFKQSSKPTKESSYQVYVDFGRGHDQLATVDTLKEAEKIAEREKASLGNEVFIVELMEEEKTTWKIIRSL